MNTYKQAWEARASEKVRAARAVADAAKFELERTYARFRAGDALREDWLDARDVCLAAEDKYDRALDVSRGLTRALEQAS